MHFLTMDSGLKLQVDSPVYSAVDEGGLIRKQAWSRELSHNGSVIRLTFSRDYHGMVRLMPAIIGMIVVTAVFALGARRDSGEKSVTSPA